MKGAIKSNGGQENRSAKDYSNVILSQRFAEKMRKCSELAKASNISCAHDDGVFNECNCKISDQESDDDIASINSKDNDDDADDNDD